MTIEDFKKQVIDISSGLVQHLNKIKCLGLELEELNYQFDNFDFTNQNLIREDEEFMFKLENREKAFEELLKELDF